jgi:hypothetical protein
MEGRESMPFEPGKKIGEARICAKERWNRTGIRLQAGQEYAMAAEGTWFDRQLEYGPAGGPAKSPVQGLFALFRRRRNEPWFVLTGAIDADPSTAFRIGATLNSYRPDRSGELTCFANDVWLAHGNNSGSVQLTVWRTSDAAVPGGTV